MSDRYQVAWPYVTVKILDDAGGSTVVGYNADAILPTSADPEDVKRLLVKGALKAVAATEPKAEPKAEAKAPAKAESKADAKAEPKTESKSAKA